MDMTFDFETRLPLRGNHSSKYANIGRTFGTDAPDMIPMWVADMDFAAAPCIVDAVREETERGFYGYFGEPGPVNDAVTRWLRDKHGWEIDPRTIRYTHGVISGLGDVIQTFSEAGDGVIVFSPVYHAFYRQIGAMGREVVESPLVVEDGRFQMDLAALGERLTARDRILLLCSPHNPGGRMWSVDELRAVAAFCENHGLILISDEIHMDLTHPDLKHVPTLGIAPHVADRTVVLTAASKGFNLAGGETGILIATDDQLRRKLDATILDRESSPNRFGMAMIKAAFSEGDAWSAACRRVIADNIALLTERLNTLPGVRVMECPATYLVWVDFTNTGLTDAELMDRMLKGARVAPSPGTQFGTGGAGHLRFNVALPRAMLEEALDRIEAAFADLQ